MNEITKVDGTIEPSKGPDWANKIEACINQIVSETEAREVIDNMTTLEHRLQEARMLKRYACEFCRLEAQMWVQIAASDIDVSTDLFTRSERTIVTWLRGKSVSEIKKVVAKCATGTRISNVRSSEVSDHNDRAREDEYKRISDKIVSECVEGGTTKLTTGRFYKEWRGPGKPDRTAIASYRERTKNMLLQRDCIGCGDGSGLYVSKRTGSQQQKADAIATRIRSILDDMDNLVEICSESKLKVPNAAIVRMHNKIDELALIGSDAA